MKTPEIRIESIEAMHIIYIRFKGTYKEFRKNSRTLYNKLFTYALRKNLINPEQTKVLTIYHDNPYITAESNLRTSVAMIVPNTRIVDETEDICTLTIAGKFYIGRFNLTAKEYDGAWKYMYYDSLFQSQHTPRDSFPFEMYITEPPKNFIDSSITEIYIPIE